MENIIDSILSFDSQTEEDFYQILGCTEHSTLEQVNTEYRVRVLTCHPDKHPDDANAAQRFKALQKAKDVLGDPIKRHKYDMWRNSGLAIPYSKWCVMQDSMIPSMHWAVPKGEPMIEAASGHTALPGNEEQHIENTKPPWKRDAPSDTLWKFRNYEI